MPVIINKNNFPLVVITLDGDMTIEGYQNLTTEWENLYINKENFYFIFHTINNGKIKLKILYMLAMFIKKMKRYPEQYLLRSIIVLEKTKKFERSLLRLLFSIQAPSAPVYLVTSIEESVVTHKDLLEDKELSKNIICYK